jgi:hypothetical protein
LNAGFSDRCVARRGNTIVPPLLFPTSPNFSSALHRLYFGRANAIVRLRRNQNSAVLPFSGQIEDQTKASENFKLIFLSAQSTHLDLKAVPNWSCVFTHLRTFRGLWRQKLCRHLKLPDSRRGCSQLLRVIQIHHFGYITSWRLRNSSSASLLSQHCWGARQLFAPRVERALVCSRPDG